MKSIVEFKEGAISINPVDVKENITDETKIVKLPSTVQVIEQSAFVGCENLEEIDFSKATNLKKIESYAFSGCKSLKRIIFPSSIEVIGPSAFADCENLEDFGLTDNLSSEEIIDESDNQEDSHIDIEAVSDNECPIELDCSTVEDKYAQDHSDLNQERAHKDKEFDFGLDVRRQQADDEHTIKMDEHAQGLSDRNQERAHKDREFDFDLDVRRQQADDEHTIKMDEHADNRTIKMDEHAQDLSDWNQERAHKDREFDFDLDVRRQQADDEHTIKMDEHADNRTIKMDEHAQDLSDWNQERAHKDRVFDFDLDVRRQQADDEHTVKMDEHVDNRTIKMDEHAQDLSDWNQERAHKDKEFDFDLDVRRQQADDEHTIKMDEHAQDLSDWNQERVHKDKEFDFDLDVRRQQADDEHTIKMDEHAQDLSDWNQERAHKDKEFDFDLDVRRQKADDEHTIRMSIEKEKLRQEAANFDFDLAIKKQNADTDSAIRMGVHTQDMADRESTRRQEELKLKADLSLQNMQAMLKAKREAKQDEYAAQQTELEIRSRMSEGQIAAEQLKELDAAAQAGFMEALKEEKSSHKMNEALRHEMEYKERIQEDAMKRADELHQQNSDAMKDMMDKIMEMARYGMDTTAKLSESNNQTKNRLLQEHVEKESMAYERNAAERRVQDLEKDNARYRDDMQYAQQRLDSTQKHSLDYTTRVTEQKIKGMATSSSVRLNTSWLREHGFKGSFNELAAKFNDIGGEISPDSDEYGNPIIVIRKLSHPQVMQILENCGVEF